MIRIFIADTGTLNVERALATVSPQRREKALGISNEASRSLSLGAALLMQNVLGSSDCTVSANGKPFFSGSDMHFSLAHCREKVVCAVSDAPVGVDIELERKNSLSLARRWFAPDESAAVESAVNPDEEFCVIWTIKESYIKLRDLRLADMRRFSVMSLDAEYKTLRFGEYHIGCCADRISEIKIIEEKI